MKVISLYIVLFMIYSIMGWLMEIVVTLIEDHKFVNRGFLIGPYCPIYGYGCLLIIFLLQKYQNDPVVLFLMSILICSFLEYMTSYLMEKIFHARWWDYSKRKFNINGRICLETMIPFGFLGCLILYVVNPFYVEILSKLPIPLLYGLAIFSIIIYLIDNILSFHIIAGFKNEIKKIELDQTEEIVKKVKDTLRNKGILYKRLFNAFPHIKTSREFLLDLQKRIDETLKHKKHKKK